MFSLGSPLSGAFSLISLAGDASPTAAAEPAAAPGGRHAAPFGCSKHARRHIRLHGRIRIFSVLISSSCTTLPTLACKSSPPPPRTPSQLAASRVASNRAVSFCRAVTFG
eukprot:6191496-Pleurochrysis_carterae.AAC.1